MSNPWQDDPTVVRWAQHVIDDMVPKMQSSSVCVSFVPNGDLAEKGDVKYWVELGAMICMEKPILLVVMGDAELPPKMQAVADKVIRLPEGVNLASSESLAKQIAEFAAQQAGVIPACQGIARFDLQEQAEYVAMSESDVQGTPWRARPCGDHWHVEEEAS